MLRRENAVFTYFLRSTCQVFRLDERVLQLVQVADKGWVAEERAVAIR